MLESLYTSTLNSCDKCPLTREIGNHPGGSKIAPDLAAPRSSEHLRARQQGRQKGEVSYYKKHNHCEKMRQDCDKAILFGFLRYS